MCGCLSRTPYWGPGPQPGMCPDWKSNLKPCGCQVLNPLSHSSQGSPWFLQWEAGLSMW